MEKGRLGKLHKKGTSHSLSPCPFPPPCHLTALQLLILFLAVSGCRCLVSSIQPWACSHWVWMYKECVCVYWLWGVWAQCVWCVCVCIGCVENVCHVCMCVHVCTCIWCVLWVWGCVVICRGYSVHEVCVCVLAGWVWGEYVCGVCVQVWGVCITGADVPSSWHKQEGYLAQTKHWKLVLVPSSLVTARAKALYFSQNMGRRSHPLCGHTLGRAIKIYRSTKGCQPAFLPFTGCWLHQWLSNSKWAHLFFFNYSF